MDGSVLPDLEKDYYCLHETMIDGTCSDLSKLAFITIQILQVDIQPIIR